MSDGAGGHRKGTQMSSVRAALAVVAALGTSGAAANAADLYGGSIKDAPYAVQMAAPSPTIYLRADTSYGAYDDPAIVEENIYDLTETSISSSWAFGGGFGFYLPRNFRADFTVDRRLESDVAGNLTQGAEPGFRNFGMKSTVALANLYYDFDFGNRFTPYVGIGLGVANNETSDGTVVDTTGATVATITGDSSTHVAGAAMAGPARCRRGGDPDRGRWLRRDRHLGRRRLGQPVGHGRELVGRPGARPLRRRGLRRHLVEGL